MTKGGETMKEKNPEAVKLGTRGGQKTKALYGKKHYSKAGKLGNLKRWGNKNGSPA